MRRILVLALTGMFCAGLLCGCGKKATPTEEETKQTQTKMEANMKKGMEIMKKGGGGGGGR